jgi:hypothetical protein
MAEISRLKVVLCWHMHQPEYRDLTTGESLLPWTYLHAIKDYADMAAHLEAAPRAAAVVNFSPVLLEQLAAYAQQLAAHLINRAPLRDALLASLAPDGIPEDLARREQLVRSCLKVNRERIIERFAPFRELATLATAPCAMRRASFSSISPSGITSAGSANPCDGAMRALRRSSRRGVTTATRTGARCSKSSASS